MFLFQDEEGGREGDVLLDPEIKMETSEGEEEFDSSGTKKITRSHFFIYISFRLLCWQLHIKRKVFIAHCTSEL